MRCVGLALENSRAGSGRRVLAVAVAVAGAAARPRERPPGVEVGPLQPRGARGAEPEGGLRLLQEHAACARQRAARTPRLRLQFRL